MTTTRILASLLFMTFITAVGAAGDLAAAIGETQAQASAEIASLRYGGSNLDAASVFARLSELMPASDRPYYRQFSFSVDPLDLTQETDAGRVLELLRRDARLWQATDDPEVVDHLLSVADRAGSRLFRCLILLKTAAARDGRGNEIGAWYALEQAARALPPGPRLARLHAAVCGARSLRHISVAIRRDNLRVGWPDDEVAAPPGHGPAGCPLARDPILAERIDLAHRIPAIPGRSDGPAMDDWLAAMDALAAEASDPGSLALLRMVAWTYPVEHSATVADQERMATELEALTVQLSGDRDGPRLAAFAAQAALTAQRPATAARLLAQALGGGEVELWAVQDTARRLASGHPDLIVPILRDAALGNDDPALCWVLGLLSLIEGEEAVPGPYTLELALGRCDPTGSAFNREVELARRRLVETFEREGSLRPAFAIQALRHYRSSCGMGAAGAAAAILRHTADLQIAADLDADGSARAFLDRQEGME